MTVNYIDSNIVTRGNVINWDVSNVTDMSSMFEGAEKFNNATISNWNVSSVTNMSSMFAGALVFNGNVSAWDVSNVENVSAMFKDTSKFKQNLQSWNLQSNIIVDETRIKDIFSGAALMNQQYICHNWTGISGTVWKQYFNSLGFGFTCP